MNEDTIHIVVIEHDLLLRNLIKKYKTERLRELLQYTKYIKWATIYVKCLRGPLSKIHPSVFERKNKFSSYFVYELDFGQH